MKKIDYYTQPLQMGDLLAVQGVHFEDYPHWKVAKLRRKIEKYMDSGKAEKPLIVNLKTFKLVIQGSDEAAILLNYIPE